MRRRKRGPKQHHDAGTGKLTTGRSLLAGAEARQPSQQFLQSKLKCNICYLKERFFYLQWMGKRYVPSLPAAVAEFFDELWSKHYQEAGVPFAWFAWFAVKDPCLSGSPRRARVRPPCQRPSRHVAAAGQWLNRRFVKKQDTFCPKRHFPSSVFI